MYRVLFLADLNPNKFGSLEEMVLFLGKELCSRGNELVLAVIACPVPAVAELFSNAGIKVVNINQLLAAQGRLTYIQRVNIIRELVCEQKIDLVHINFFGITDPIVLGAYLTSAIVIYTDHTSGKAPLRGIIKGWLSKCLHFLIAMKVKKYIAVSDFVRNRLQISHHVSPEKTVTIYNGVNVARFTPCNQVMARKIAGLPMDRKIILSVAMLIPEKGIQHLIHAAHILVYEYHMLDLCIVIAGEGPFREELNVLVNTLQLSEFVLFLGSRNDVDILVGAADVVAVPAIWAESFGLIIAEAMAGGRPVVASRIGGITELIKGGTNGLLVEPGDQRGLAEAILHMLNNVAYREQIVSAALSEVRERFDLSRQVAQLVDLYDTLREVVRD